MKNKRRYLSLSLIGLILFGLAGSALHVLDNTVDLSQTNQQTISEDHHFCALCASQISYDVPGTDEVTAFFPHYIELFNFPEPVISDPLFSIQNYRAPPFLS